MIENENLFIDDEFKKLIFPVPRKEFIKLERSIRTEGCKEPILVWNNTIVDGHKRYEICKNHKIHFDVMRIEFESREAVIVWICSNQLKRDNISEPIKKFLIGTQYINGKIITRAHSRTKKEYAAVDGEFDRECPPSRLRTAHDIAIENDISVGTVQKYAIFARAIEKISEKEPKLVSKILSGTYRLSHQFVVDVCDLTKEELQRVNRKIERNPTDYILYRSVRSVNRNGKVEIVPVNEYMGPSVKDMPEFDPDAEIKSLSLTIPSWQSSIERAKRNTNFAIVSDVEKKNLNKQLHSLSIAIVSIQMEMENK